MRIQLPVTDTSTASTARATFTGCSFVSNSSNKTYTDTVKILPSHRTQSLSLAFWLEPYILSFHGAKLVSELWEILRFPQSAGSDTNIILYELTRRLHKDYVLKVCRIGKLFGHRTLKFA